MNGARSSFTLLLIALAALHATAQGPPSPGNAANSAVTAEGNGQQTVDLSVPVGTPLQVVLDREVRVKKTGQPLHARLVQPVYAFDQLVLPAGSKVDGHISRIGRPSGKQLTFSILNADFSPPRPVEVTFDRILLADGRNLPLHAAIMPGSGQVIRLIEPSASTQGPAKHGLSAQLDAARQQLRQAMTEVKQPGKLHRAFRIGIAQLPLHPQYIDAGSLYFAELREPLAFGHEVLNAKAVESIGTAPPVGSVVRASLMTPLDSGRTNRGAEVQAMVTKPLFDGDRLILPQGTLLNGSVLQVRPARSMKRNGQLRIAFHEMVLPGGTPLRVDTTIEGLQAGEGAKLDSEGATKATNPKSRYVNTAISISLAMVGSGGRRDVGLAGPTAGGAVAFRLVGLAVGLAVRSHTIGILMSAYGGSRSIYLNFFGRGRNITFPRDTSMEIGFGSRTAAPISPAP
ncbi:MAG TPA: hypothetical protein VFE27_10430 [Acidobacteriaceae bacterium]|nr:hypothetical protein [Acidobacteriaceae bacterium]